MQTQTIKEKGKGIVGTIRVKRYIPGTLAVAAPYYRQARILEALSRASLGVLSDFMLGRAADLKAKAQGILDAGYLGLAYEGKNLIVSASGYGRNIVARRLGGDNTYSLNITHGEIGTGSTAPANSDTALTTPTVRVAITSADIINNVVTLRFFFSDGSLSNGTYYEFGTFIDGNATIGTGQMWNHALFGSPYAKAAGQDTTVDVEIDVN